MKFIIVSALKSHNFSICVLLGLASGDCLSLENWSCFPGPLLIEVILDYILGSLTIELWI